jgi:hypothetical protein
MPQNQSLYTRLRLKADSLQQRRLIARLARQVAMHENAHAQTDPQQSPVVIFNASTRLTGLSLNAAFALLTGWSLRLAGMPVVHFVCQAGLRPCVLGTSREDYTTPPPCEGCVAQSQRLYSGANMRTFKYQPDPRLEAALQGLGVDQLSSFTYTIPPNSANAPLSPIPLGSFALPSIRWALRRHTLPDDEPTRYLMRQYILSAFRLVLEFADLLEKVKPQTAVIFNGAMYPEAVARWVARQMGVRSVAHEVGFQQYSTFFTEGEPTAYPLDIPEDFELDADQNARLDAYLEQRFQGKFTMAGIQFWPEMRGLDEALLQKTAQFKQIVPVFTNVVYDTSQVHANVIFNNMFEWLELVEETIRAHPDTLFVIRAHPDEMRAGTRKLSNETVSQWVRNKEVDRLPNVVFIDPQELISSYELIQRAKFVIVYNSSIGMEAALMGATVLCGGNARYTQYPIVHFPHSIAEFHQRAEDFTLADSLQAPPEFQRNARRFLYYQLYRASLPLDRYIQAAPRMGFVQLRPFTWEQLLPENSTTMRVLVDGITRGESFLLPEN